MGPEYVVAIDLGTSGLHCLLVDLKGHLRLSCHERWAYETPPDTGSLGKEFQPDLLWRAVSRNVKKLVGMAGIDARDVIGVSATSQREGVVFLDRDGEALYAAPNIDLRAVAEGMVIDSEFGPEVYSITGHAPSLLFVPAKLRWFQANRPAVYDRIATVLTLSDWVIYKLCGQIVSGSCEGVEMGLADVRDGRWSDRLQKLLNLPDGISPPVVRPGTQAGTISTRAAGETGLPPGVVVAMGGPDTQCGLMAMGVRDPGQVGIVMGWSAPVQMVTEAPIIDPEGRTWTCGHPLPQRWVLESNAGESGSAFQWLAEIMFGAQGADDVETYRAMDRLAQQAPAGCDGVISFLGPTAMNVSRLGLKLGGLLFPVPLSASQVQRSHLARAFLENLCYAVKANCRQIEAVSGARIRQVSIGGGLARNECLCRMLPQVLDMPVSVSEVAEVSGLGAAMCAAAGARSYSTLEEAIESMQPEIKTAEPDRLAVMEYADHFERWSRASGWLDRTCEDLQ